MSAKSPSRPPASAAPADIAIIGMSCLFPRAPGLRQYWENILAKVNAVGEPTDEWDADRYFDPDDATGERIYTKSGGFLRDLYTFNAPEFGIMPNSVNGGEPDQFLALRVARDALLDAGYLDHCDHTNTGVILGHSTYLHRGVACIVQHGVVLDQTLEIVASLFPQATATDLDQVRALLKSKLPPFNADIAPGLVPNVMTGRICNRLNLRGPNYIIDAACSSSLLSVQAAMEELRRGTSDLMLAGGVNAAMPAEALMVFTHLGALSRRSKIQPFDENADGTLLGEGLGVVVLKRLADAQRDGDRVYAVVREVGQSSDGKGMGLLAPSLEGEILAIRRAYAQSGIDPRTVDLVEAHGTGIPLGDKTEIEALGTVFGERGDNLPHCALGSVKSMISHCIPAAGIAGLIKTTMALYHKVLPPTLCDSVNPALGIDRTSLYVNTETRPWIKAPGLPRRGAVNAFGFGGVNTHAIVEEAPHSEAREATMSSLPNELLVFCAPDRNALLRSIDRLTAYIDGADPLALHLKDIAATLFANLGTGNQRMAIIAATLSELRTKLGKARAALADGTRSTLKTRSGLYFADRPLEGKLAFMFPGEGAQYSGMLSDLAVHFPVVRRWFDFWASLYPEDSPLAPDDIVFPPPTCLDNAHREAIRHALHGVEIGSESVFIASQAINALLTSMGITPDAVVGHSSGENSALVASGTVALDNAEKLSAHINLLKRMYGDLDTAGVVNTGAMLTVGAIDRKRVLEIVDASGGSLHLALDNCDHQTVLFGDRPALEAVAVLLRGQGGLCSFLEIDRAYHTPLFTQVADGLKDAYKQVQFSTAGIDVWSCSSAERFTGNQRAMRQLAMAQWATRVRFKETIDNMFDDGVRFFVEAGPAANLTNFCNDILRGRECVVVSSDNRRRDTLLQFQHMLGRLYVHGKNPDFQVLLAGRDTTILEFDAPPPRAPRQGPVLQNTLPYVRLDEAERQQLAAVLRPARLPATNDTPAAATVREIEPPPAWPFVDRVTMRETHRVTAETQFDPEGHRYLRHHILYARHVSDADTSLHGLCVVPLAVSLEVLAETAALLCTRPYLNRLENVRAHNWIALDEGPRTVQLTAQRQEGGNDEVIHAVIADGATPLIECDVIFGDRPLPNGSAVADLGPARAPVTADDALYSTGMFHGEMFQSIGALVGWNEHGIDAHLNDTDVGGFFDSADAPQFLLNPVLLDAVGQLTAYWLQQDLGGNFSTFPSTIERIELVYPEETATAGATLRGRMGFTDNPPRTLRGDFDCISADGTALFRVYGWHDVFLSVPQPYYAARTHPRECWYGGDWSNQFPELPADTVVWLLPPCPPAFLEGLGGVSKKLLAETVLSADERKTWRALATKPKRATEWLMGRLALKEATRLWLWQQTGTLALPADIVIGSDRHGKPIVTSVGLVTPAIIPELALTHVNGNNVAVVTGPDHSVGVDLELLGRVDAGDLLRGGFSTAERSALAAQPDAVREEMVLRHWCAKEAAVKSAGTGMGGRPASIPVVPGADADAATVNLNGTMIPVAIRRSGDQIVAIAWQALASTSASARPGGTA